MQLGSERGMTTVRAGGRTSYHLRARGIVTERPDKLSIILLSYYVITNQYGSHKASFLVWYKSSCLEINSISFRKKMFTTRKECKMMIENQPVSISCHFTECKFNYTHHHLCLNELWIPTKSAQQVLLSETAFPM